MRSNAPQMAASDTTTGANAAPLPPTMMLKESQAAKHIGMSIMFLRLSRMEGARENRTPGPPYYKLGRSVRYRVADLERWLQEHRHTIELPEGE